MSRHKITSPALCQKDRQIIWETTDNSHWFLQTNEDYSNGGARYFMTITDDYSRWGDVYFLKSKDEAPSKLIEFIEKAERQTGLRVKEVQIRQSDNGTKFCNRTLDSYFKRKDIKCRLTAPHTPQQNGVAKRRNHTLVDSARCMLMQADFPNSFWAEAISTANYISNRCISKSLNAGTPYDK